MEAQKDDPRLELYIAESDKTTKLQIEKKGATYEKMQKKFEKELAAYNKKIDAGETMKNKARKLGPPFIKLPKNLAREYPGHCYNGMIHPIQPYGIKGAIWYQGERNAKYADQCVNYRKQLPLLVNYYRSSWHELSGGHNDKKFPFLLHPTPQLESRSRKTSRRRGSRLGHQS